MSLYASGPSHPRINISTLYDALVCFEGARLGYLPVIHRRLTDGEKESRIQAGNLYIWEEATSDRSSKSLRRWTDGVKWSQSRMRDPFLYYEEVPPFERTEADRANRFVSNSARSGSLGDDLHNRARHPSRRDRIVLPDGLRKLTFSVLVSMRLGDPQELWRKWHLVCYMSAVDNTVPHISQDPHLKDLEVPDGIYFDCKGFPLDNTPRSFVYYGRGALSPTPPHSDDSQSAQEAPGRRIQMAPPSPPNTPPGAYYPIPDERSSSGRSYTYVGTQSSMSPYTEVGPSRSYMSHNSPTSHLPSPTYSTLEPSYSPSPPALSRESPRHLPSSSRPSHPPAGSHNLPYVQLPPPLRSDKWSKRSREDESVLAKLGSTLTQGLFDNARLSIPVTRG